MLPFPLLLQRFCLRTRLSRKKPRMDLFQPFAFNVRVDLSGRDIRMAKHGLYGPKIRASSKEMRGK